MRRENSNHNMDIQTKGQVYMCPKKGVFKSQGKTNAENQYRKYKNLSIYIMKDFSVKAI